MLWMEEMGKGHPLVLLHPVGTSGNIWRQHTRRLSKRFRTVVVDLPGHGRSPAPEKPVSIEGMAETLYRSLQKRSLLPAHLVGLSLGGMVAQMMAAIHPASVSALILCDTVYEVNPAMAEVLQERARAVEQSGMAATIKPTIARWFAPGFPERNPDVAAMVEKLLEETDPVVNAQTWRAIAGFDIVSRPRQSARIPALIVMGALDTSLPPDAGKQLSEAYGADLKELPGCAHMAPLEDPDAFMDALESFLPPAN